MGFFSFLEKVLIPITKNKNSISLPNTFVCKYAECVPF
jgi:hypothetical protein